MPSNPILIEQVREILILTNNEKPRHEIYNQFINECKVNSLTEDDFYKNILRPASKSIDWVYIEEEKKRKEEATKIVEEELKKLEELNEAAPIFIDRLIKIAFEDGVVESNELIKIFEKADKFNLDSISLAKKIDKIIDKKQYKSYPKADMDAATLRETLCSSNWYNPSHYTRMTTPPPPPPKPFPWMVLVTSFFLILGVGGFVAYNFFYVPYVRDRDAPRYYTFANDAVFRSSQIAGVDYNKIKSLEYGAELITYNYGAEWATVKNIDKEGYVNSKLLLNKTDFHTLNSIFGDIESKGTIVTTKCRKALLKYWKDKNYLGKMDTSLQRDVFGSIQTNKEEWQIFTKGKKVKINTVYYPRIYNTASKFTDFAVLIKKASTNERRLLIFAFLDNEDAILYYDEPAPENGYIESIKKSNRYELDGSLKIKFTEF